MFPEGQCPVPSPLLRTLSDQVIRHLFGHLGVAGPCQKRNPHRFTYEATFAFHTQALNLSFPPSPAQTACSFRMEKLHINYPHPELPESPTELPWLWESIWDPFGTQAAAASENAGVGESEESRSPLIPEQEQLGR